MNVVSYLLITMTIFSLPSTRHAVVTGLKLKAFYGDPDLHATTRKLIESRGFGCEVHQVTTKDGYILSVHRIMHPDLLTTKAPVLMFHGIMGSASNFLVNDRGGDVHEDLGKVGPNLGFELAKRGYDVWLFDQRGNPGSRNHTYLNADRDLSYWDFSIDEFAFYDLPAVIWYMQLLTERRRIGFVGHSQGTTAMLFLMSRRKKYNHIIRPFICLSPVFYLGNSNLVQVPLNVLTKTNAAEIFLKTRGGALVNGKIVSDAFDQLCSSLSTQSFACPLIANAFLSSIDHADYNYLRSPVYVTTEAFVISSKQLAHFLQLARTNVPSSLDPTTSPESLVAKHALYDAGKITCDSIAFITSVHDVFSDPQDVQDLRNALNVRLVYDEVITQKGFGHGSMLFGIPDHVSQFVNDPVLKILDSFYPSYDLAIYSE